jgi:hypothetical protein
MKKGEGYKIIDVSLILMILIILVVVIILIIGGFLKSRGSTENTYKNIIERCLLKESDSNCRLLFSSPGIADECKKIKDSGLRDKCLEKAGILNLNAEYCRDILNEEIKENCFMGSAFPNEEIIES